MFDENGAQYAWDSSSLKLVEACLYKYKLKIIDRWQPNRKSVHLLFGGWYATALENFHKAIADGVDYEQAVCDVVHEALIATWEYEKEPCTVCSGFTEVPATEQSGLDNFISCLTCEGKGYIEFGGTAWVSDHNTKTRENLIRTIIWYLDQFRDDPCKTVILTNGAAAVEHSFKLPVDNDVILCGHLDRLVDYGGKLYVQDQKAQPVTERVLTPKGWTAIGRLVEGSLVIGQDGNAHPVVGIFPKGEVEIYEVQFNDGTSTRCAWDHLWGVYDQNKKYQVLSMEEMATAPAYKKFRVPLVQPVQHVEANLPLHPLALGLLIGDGYLGGSVIQFSDADGIEAGWLSSVLPEGDDIVKTGSANYTWNIRGGNTRRILMDLELFGKRSGGKFIPDLYMFASERQRRELLRGLLETDGCYIETNWLYDSTSEQLVKDVCQLVRSLGGVASYHPRSGNAYRAHLRMPEWANGVRSRIIKKVVKLPYTEQAVCIKVDAPRNLYVTENYILTHNTTGTTITPRFFDGFNPDTQMSLYSFAGKAIFGLPIKGVMIDGAQIAVGFTRFERGFTFRDDAQLTEWYDTALYNVERVRTATRDNYFPQNASACGNYGGCEFRHICARSPAVRQNFLRGDFVQGEQWNPLIPR